jgi:hypothetical protein
VRIRPNKAGWNNGYQAKPLFDNAPHTRKTVVSIFKESAPSPISRQAKSSWKRNDQTGASDD